MSKRKKRKSKTTRVSKKAKSPALKKPDPPLLVQIDITPQLYEQIKEETIKSQHPVVRPYLESFIDYLKKLDPLDVYEAVESGQTIKDYYNQPGNYDIKITTAAARALLKASSSLREKADRALNVKFGKLVLRFENPDVYNIIMQWGGEEYLKKNIEDLKIVLGIKKEKKK